MPEILLTISTLVMALIAAITQSDIATFLTVLFQLATIAYLLRQSPH